MKLKSYVAGEWVAGTGNGTPLFNAVTGTQIAIAGSEGVDFKSMLEYARNVGGPALRKMTFHERVLMLKKLAMFLNDKKALFYELSAATGATKIDSWIDIDGGIGTMFVFASKGRRELPDETFLVEGNPEQISKNGTFLGHHICVPLHGVAIHINAYNFPCWGMLEKIAPTFLAGVPAIIKPATVTSYLTELMVREIINSGILPPGALQLICGGAGDILDHVTLQDVVTFTGSASTGRMLKQHPAIIENSVRFNMEADSLNFSMLGPEATPGSAEFGLFIREVTREMTVKAGQKCTAIRRILVPDHLTDAVVSELKLKLAAVKLGNPAVEGVKMGPLASTGQVAEVKTKLAELLKSCEVAYGNINDFEVTGADKATGAFMPAMLLHCKDGIKNNGPHDIEAFGPVSTIMGYKNTDDAIELARKGKGSLVGSVFSADNNFAREIVMGTAAWHGRLMVVNEASAAESTGHGSPLGHLVHGGPGRAGGGEEMGGIRGVKHYMQRTAVQGSPTTLTSICKEFMRGSEVKEDVIHPFRKYFEEIQIGDTLFTHRRTVTEADIVNFAGISVDFFYAHTDETSLEGSVFEKRVAHGYFIISAAAGLFVDPKKGPVLANYGLDSLRFTQPVYVGDTISVRLTCKRKTKKEKREGQIPQGVVEWDVEVKNQKGETVATETVLTLVERKEDI
ncbi:MAG: phenylacetic acid degradation bifunctional protein PaaZ [Bacteroidetes bacterium]|nr:phenylacetic acid degradation bifunctional protein PaaZ [Bacteroidota bacterium]